MGNVLKLNTKAFVYVFHLFFCLFFVCLILFMMKWVIVGPFRFMMLIFFINLFFTDV